MKKLICAIMAVMCGISSVNAGEMQELYCGDKSLSYCIRHYDSQCEPKNYGACDVLGVLYYEQERYSESKKYLEMVCDKADSKSTFQVELIDGSLGNKVPAIEAIKSSCSNLAKYYYNGWGVRQDFAKALQYRKKACDLGSGDGCAGAGLAYILGKGTKIDYKLAKNYFEKSCEMQNGVGCGSLGYMYHKGEGVKQNISKAKELYGKSCDFGYQNGCDEYKKLNK